MLLRLIRDFLRPYRALILALVGLQLISTIAMLFLPSLNADIIDNGVVTGDTGYILRFGALMLSISMVQVLCSIAAVWFAARTAMAFGRDVRGALFSRVGSFSARELQQFGAPSLITRETNDVQQVQMLVLLAGTLMVSAPIMMVGAVFMALREDIGLSWLLAAVVP
ncbi:MAG TPA: ABC transporter transmembrane domain-containing protein, partial [Marmoricola sp.]|nr:ABC transporter transmembrane domain-containing protein [Marmoricola sp.]